MGGFSKTWCHMRMAYPKRLPQADAVDAWKTAPVAWETCWDMRKWVDEGLVATVHLQLRLGPARVGRSTTSRHRCLRASTFGQKLERFLRRLGYRLVLKELKHPKQAKPGEDTQAGHEVAERRLGSVLPAVPSGLPTDRWRRGSSESSSAMSP